MKQGVRGNRIVVLGAGGFVGSHIVPALLERLGCEIDAVDIDFDKLEVDDARLHRIRARIETPGLLEPLIERAQLVISLSALCNPALYSTVPLAVIDGNYTHLVPVVQRCAERGVRLIHFSTSEVYGRLALDGAGERTATMNEDRSALMLGPINRERWTYACAKQLLERVIWAHGAHGDLSFTIVRLFNVIGPRMDFLPGIDGEGIPRVLASFMNALLRSRELQLVDGGKQRRTFMAVSDMVEAVCRIVERPAACHNQILNLGNPDNDVSIEQLAHLLGDVFAARVPGATATRLRNVSAAEFYGEGYDDSEQRIPDIAKARRVLDWQPRQRLAEMLPEIVDAYVARYAERIAEARRCELPTAPTA
jgi:UDP-apiose/xylose synthase